MPVTLLVAVATGPVVVAPAVQVTIDRLEPPVVGTGCHQGPRRLPAVIAGVEHQGVQHVEGERRRPVQTWRLLEQLPELGLWELVYRDAYRCGEEEAGGGVMVLGVRLGRCQCQCLCL